MDRCCCYFLSFFLSPLNDNFNVSKPKTETGVRHNTTHTLCVCKVSKLVTFIWLLPALCCPLSFFSFSFFSTKGFLCAFLFLLWIWFIASESEGRRKTEGNGMEGEGEKEKAACVLTKRSLLRNCHCRRLIARFWLFSESSRPPLFSLGR